jgi:hypothetical protein
MAHASSPMRMLLFCSSFFRSFFLFLFLFLVSASSSLLLLLSSLEDSSTALSSLFSLSLELLSLRLLLFDDFFFFCFSPRLSVSLSSL